MTNEEKRSLLILLRKYQVDLLKADASNAETDKKYQKWTMDYYKHWAYGVKAQYNHARIIADRLDAEIGRNIQSL